MPLIRMLSALLGSALLFNGAASAQSPGDLDPAFGSEAGLTAVTRGVSANGDDIAALPDGRWIVSGIVHAAKVNKAPRYRAMLSRFRPDGALDRTFGNDGTALSSMAFAQLWSTAVIRDGDRILQVVANDDATNSNRLYVFAYTSEGRPDPSYGNGGVAAIDAVAQNVDAAAVLQGGRLLIAGRGSASVGTGTRPMLVRLTSSGALDATFGNNGIAFYDVPQGQIGSFKRVALQADGKIVAAGESFLPGAETNLLIARFGANGALDAGFGSGGFRTVDLLGNDFDAGLAIESNGRIVVGASACEGSGGDNGYCFAAAVRLLGNGALDPAFGEGGATVHPVVPLDIDPTWGNLVLGVTVDAQGGLMFGGQNYYYGSAFILRLDASGSPDPAFGTAGVVLAPYREQGWSGEVHALKVAATGDGPRLMTVGRRQREGVQSEMVIARHFFETE